ncbi:hypothetical protein Tco_0663593 [Tanacetum coccineum]
MLFIMLSWKRAAKIVHQCWHRVITFSGNPESRDTLTPNLTVNSSTIVSKIHHTHVINRLRKKTVSSCEGVPENNLQTRYMENYKNVSQDIRDQLNAETEVVQIILTEIDNDIYSTVDALRMHNDEMSLSEISVTLLIISECPVLTSIQLVQPEWQRFVTLVKQSQELKTVSYHKLYDILKQHQTEVNEIREPATVTKDDEMSKEKEIDKLMALISLAFKKIYNPTNNNLRTSSNTNRANQDNSPRNNTGTGYENQREVNVAGARENVGTQIQEVTPDAADNSGPIFDDEPLQNEPESVNDTYLEEHGDTNITVDSLDMYYDRDQDD